MQATECLYAFDNQVLAGLNSIRITIYMQECSFNIWEVVGNIFSAFSA